MVLIYIYILFYEHLHKGYLFSNYSGCKEYDCGSLSNTNHQSELIGRAFIIPEVQYIFAEFKQFQRKDSSWLMVWPGAPGVL